jgi:RNAse (barnase) inhibitor barstar
MASMELDWRLLRDGPIVLYFRPETLAADIAWLRGHSYDVKELDASTWADEVAMHDDLAATLSFPDYYGKNLNALNDCLAYLKGARRAIVFRRYDAFAKKKRPVAQAVLDILAANSRELLIDGTRLLVFVQSDDPNIAFDPVGATAVSWNRKEWLNANRGV